jgi:hypothetical protein
MMHVRFQSDRQEPCICTAGAYVPDRRWVADVPDNESMAAIALAVGSGGAIKASRTTVLMTGTEGVAALEKADAVAKTYSPAG